jgi:hypothetical protein
MPKTWCIVSYRAGEVPNAARGAVQSSIGKPYRDLVSIAKRMGRGDGWRYCVREAPSVVVPLDAFGGARPNEGFALTFRRER